MAVSGQALTTQPASRSPPRGPGSASGKSSQQTATTKTRRWDGDPEAAPRTPSAGWLSRDRGPMASNPRAGVGGVTLNLCPVLRILEEGARGRLSWASRNFYRPQRTDSYPSPGSPHLPPWERGDPLGGWDSPSPLPLPQRPSSDPRPRITRPPGQPQAPALPEGGRRARGGAAGSPRAPGRTRRSRTLGHPGQAQGGGEARARARLPSSAPRPARGAAQAPARH